jgi:hypothetical protein
MGCDRAIQVIQLRTSPHPQRLGYGQLDAASPVAPGGRPLRGVPLRRETLPSYGGIPYETSGDSPPEESSLP